MNPTSDRKNEPGCDPVGIEDAGQSQRQPKIKPLVKNRMHFVIGILLRPGTGALRGTRGCAVSGAFLVLLLAAGSRLAAQTQTGSVVTVNADKTLVLNGRKVFPIGFSPGPPTNGRTPGGGDALQELRDAGALLFRMTQTADWSTQVRADQQAALDWAAQHGMYCWVNLRELSKFASGDTNTEAMLRNLVQTFRDHPAVGLWKNFDEAWWGGVSEADLQRGYDVIKQEDANHPVVQTHAPRGTVQDLQPYNAAADVLALDIYPVGYPPGANSLLTNKEISMVGDWTDFLGQVANGQKEYWMIEQIAWSGATPPTKTLRFPTFEQERFMAYQAIIHGARGLMYFGGTVAATLTPQDAQLGWNWTFWNQVLKRVVQELGDNSLLASALVTSNSTLPITVSGAAAPDLEFIVREAPPYLYILACKREGATVNVTFSGLPASAGSNGELLYESPRAVLAQNGQFTDWFGPFEVHAYRFYNTNQVVAQTNHLLLYESFDYANIGGPVSSNTPANWAPNGSGANDLNVTGGSLSYAGLAAPVGNSVTNGGVGLGVRRLFGASLTSGTVYFSALFNINNLGYGVWNGAAAQVGALTAIDNTSFRLAVMVRSNSSSGYVVGVQKGGTGAASTFDATEYHAGDTLFLVGKYDFNVTPNVVSLWIDPSPSTFGAAIDPAAGFITASSGTDGFTIDRFNMRQNTASSVPAAMQWDELRVGASWADVTPVPTPTGTTLTGLTQLSAGAFQFAYTNTTGSAQGSSVYASTNLIDWAPIGSAMLIAPGLYQFTDTTTTNYSHRFYQLRSP